MPRVAAKAKEFRYAIDLDEGGALRTEDGTPLTVDPAWSPTHLLLPPARCVSPRRPRADEPEGAAGDGVGRALPRAGADPRQEGRARHGHVVERVGRGCEAPAALGPPPPPQIADDVAIPASP